VDSTGGGRPGVCEIAYVEELQVPLQLLGLGRRCEHDREAALLQLGDEVAGALERLDLVDARHVEGVVGGAHIIPLLLVEPLAGERLDDLVAAHADVAVDPPKRQREGVHPEVPVPREAVGGSSCRRASRRRRGWRCGPWNLPTLPA
jgi:hypothetical protein